MSANAKWKEILHACKSPLLDPPADEVLKEFMARKKASMQDIRH